MEFDPGSAKEIGFEVSFDPSTATEVKQFDPTSAQPVKPKLTVSQEISPIKPKDPTKGKEFSFLGDIKDRLIGTGVDVTDLVASIGPQAMSYAESIRLGSMGAGSGEAGAAMEQVRHAGQLRELYPNLEDYPANPAIQGFFEKISEGIKLATDKAFGKYPTPGKIAAEDALAVLLLGGAAKAMKGKGDVPPAPKTDAATIVKNLEPTLTDVDTSKMKTPQYMGAKERGLAQESVTATGEPAYGEMGYKITNEKEFYKPYWPDQELQKSIQQANNVVDDAATMRDMKDVNAEQIKSPYMSEAEVKTAQGFADAKDAPAAWEMDFQTEAPGAVSKMADQRTTDLQTNAKLANELHQAKTLPEAITTVRKYLKDPDQLAVSEVLQRFASKDVGFEALNPDDVAGRSKDSSVQLLNDTPEQPGALGLHITGERGSQQVAVRGMGYFLEQKKRDGLNPETVLHETVHSITDKAFYVATHPELIKDPKYANHVKYSADMNDLRLSLMKELPPDVVAHFDAAFENAAEFNAYGWTSPAFREALAKIELKGYGKNAWERFKDVVKQFFGQDITTTNALKAVDGFMDRLDTIQHADKADVGMAVKRLNDAAEGVSKQVDKPQTADELKATFPIEDVPDLNSFTGKNIFTSNQVKNIVKHPWVDYAWEKINTIKRQEEVKQAARRDVYEQFVKTNEKDLLTIYKTLVDIQKEPYELRAQIEAGGKPAIKDYLKSKGLDENLSEKTTAMLSILRDVEGSDRMMATMFDRQWQHQPLYAPLSHGGRFRVLAKDQNGDVVMAKGFQKASDAAKFYTELSKEKLPDGITLENVKRSELNSLKSDMAEMMLSQALPEYLKKQIQSVEQTMEVSRRKFEMERRAKVVSGYVGEELGDPNTGYGQRQRQALIDSFEARIDASFDFGVKARIAKEVLEPLLGDPATQALKPELHNYLNQLLMREMGFPISKTAALVDRPLQAFADKAFGKPMNNLSNILRGNEPNDVSMLGPRAVENLVQGWTWATSLAKLGWNMNTWLANSTAIPLVSLEGWRVAHKEGVNPWYAVLAANDSRQFALGLGDTSAKSWMEMTKREGMVDALISDTYTLDPSMRRKLPDRVANAPRDMLEYATNFNTIQYFYHFYKRVLGDKVDVNSEAFKTKVYEAARSWTGDYSVQATPLALSQMGTAGRGMGNFSKWRFNQLGRLVDDISTIINNPTSGHAWGALLALLTTQTLMGGIYGLTGVADYEALRRFGQWTGLWEWRPFSMWYDEANKAVGNAIPEWMRKGALTAGSDAIAQQFGEESGPDMSGSLRFSSFLEPPTVSLKYFLDVYKGLEWVGNRSLQAAGVGSGVSHQESKEAINALPTSIKSAINDYFKIKVEEDGKTRYITQQKKIDKGQYEQTPFQRGLDIAGLKTTKENDFNDRVFAAEWLKKHNAKQIGEKLAAALNWAVEPEGRALLDKTGVNSPDPELVTKNLQAAYDIGGMTTLRQFVDQLKGKPLDRATTYDQRLVLDAMRQQDGVRKKQLLEQVQKFIELKESRNTSSNR